ncbi:MAG: hypothetical protein ACP5U0_09410 [Caldisphaera sp.]
MKVKVIFIPPRSRESSPMLNDFYKEIHDKLEVFFKNNLNEIKIEEKEVYTKNDALEVVNSKDQDLIGYVLINFNSISGILRPFLWSDVPTLLISETYTGSGEFLLEYSKALNNKKPVIGVSLRDFTDFKNLKKLIKYVYIMKVLYKLKQSKMLVIVGPDTKGQMELEYPLSVDLYNLVGNAQTLFGLKIELMDVKDFNEKYYKKISDKDAEPIVEKWFSGAEKVIDHTKDELIKPAKLYLALKKLVDEEKIDAIGIDDIVLFYNGFLDAWPCLPFVELTLNKHVTMCEGDIASGILMLFMKYYANIPGYINDPAMDNLNNKMIYYHCFAPINFKGYDNSEICKYYITPAHWGFKKASVFTLLPLNVTVTLVGLSLEEKVLTLHTAKSIDNEYNLNECASKLVAETNTINLAKNWKWKAGWHRVAFYGNWEEDFHIMASFLKLTFIKEDQ